MDDEEDYSNVELSANCAEQVELVLERRAVKVKLHPDIEDACRGFLIHGCTNKIKIGEEMQCLQVSQVSLTRDLQILNRHLSSFLEITISKNFSYKNEFLILGKS